MIFGLCINQLIKKAPGRSNNATPIRGLHYCFCQEQLVGISLQAREIEAQHQHNAQYHQDEIGFDGAGLHQAQELPTTQRNFA